MRKSRNRLTEAEAEARLSRGGLMAQEQWKRHAPKHYAALKKSGKLCRALLSAQSMAAGQFVRAVQRGDDPHEAQRSALESLHRFDPENDPAKEEPWEEEAAEYSAMQATRRLLEEPSEAEPQSQLEFEGLVESEERGGVGQMAELHRANGDPLCQVAKSKLIEAGEKPDPEQLYPLQLLRWAVGKGKLVPRRDLWDRQRPMLELLEGEDSQVALDFLTKPDEDSRLDDPEALSKESPADVAEEILQMLHSRMAATQQDYPLPRSD